MAKPEHIAAKACQHDAAEMDTACADGLCPLCLRREVGELRIVNSEAFDRIKALEARLEKVK